MEIDDGGMLFSLDKDEDAADQCTDSDASHDDLDKHAPDGPRDFAELQKWPELLVDQMKTAEDDNGEENIAFANSMFNCGFVLESDFAGTGGGEIGLTGVVDAFASEYGLESHASTYRSGDVGELQRRTLMHAGWEGPSHVTGDICHCVPSDGRRELNKLHTRAQRAFEEQNKSHSTAAAADVVGCSFMASVIAFLATVTFLGAQWCFKHKRRCTLHDPPSMGIRCMIAGTICKPFS